MSRFVRQKRQRAHSRVCSRHGAVANAKANTHAQHSCEQTRACGFLFASLRASAIELLRPKHMYTYNTCRRLAPSLCLSLSLRLNGDGLIGETRFGGPHAHFIIESWTVMNGTGWQKGYMRVACSRVKHARPHRAHTGEEKIKRRQIHDGIWILSLSSDRSFAEYTMYGCVSLPVG